MNNKKRLYIYHSFLSRNPRLGQFHTIKELICQLDYIENMGFNAKTKKFVDLFEAGVLDSAKVLRVSLENSISAASMILLIDCTISDEPEKKKDCCCGGDPMAGMM